MLSLVMMCAPLRLGADCCGGGSGSGGGCGEKQTLVHWRFEGHGWGKVTVAGYYADDIAIPIVEQVVLAKTSGCIDGEFCADDGRVIEWTITAHTDPNPPSTGTTANLEVTWGCSGRFKLSSHDVWKLHPDGPQQPESTGRMSTGETNGCGCPDGFGQATGLNGSVHVEWDLGQRFGPFYGMDVEANNMVLPKMLLSLSLPPEDGNCSPSLLRIPQP